ncbi:MAG TPA: macro domain-containing protein [Gammaproteobacteria bacterium]|nr:macro domain-containing protein [Gammaproteobacteria bacterium]
MSERSMQFLYGDRELLIQVSDILKAPVDVIVNPANGGLKHGGGLAAQISDAAGEELDNQSAQLVDEHGIFDSGMAVYTGAGELPYKAVIHAVGPRMGEGDEQFRIEQAVSRSLLLCEINEWHSIAFPAISTGIFRVPVEICARAFFRATTSFWDARYECFVEKIMLCLTEENFRPFFDAFRNDAITPTEETEEPAADEAAEENVGYVELDEDDIAGLENDEINDWFK